jgi:hypothetical protein
MKRLFVLLAFIMAAPTPGQAFLVKGDRDSARTCAMLQSLGAYAYVSYLNGRSADQVAEEERQPFTEPEDRRLVTYVIDSVYSLIQATDLSDDLDTNLVRFMDAAKIACVDWLAENNN